MSKPTHVLTAKTSDVNDPIAKAAGKATVGVAVYGDADLKTRTDAAKAAGIPVTVRKA